MGSVGGLLGTAGGASGTGFAAPNTGNVVSQGQLDTSNQGANAALAQQQAFTNAVGANGTAGLAAQGNVLNQLQQGAAGQGPNPALAQLNQTTGQNVANQSALMAGQRGASQNAGLIARQAAQQGANTQQQAVGQAATQQAQQQIAYQQALAQQANTQVGQQQTATTANTGAALQQQLGLTGTAAGLQSSVNAGNAGLASTSMQGQQGLVGGLTNGLGSLLANGGRVMAADGGLTAGSPISASPQQPPAAAGVSPVSPAQPSSMGKFMAAATGANQPGHSDLYKGASALGASLAKMFSSGNSTPSPDAQYSASGFSPDQMSDSRAQAAGVSAGAIPSPMDPSQQLQQQYGQANPTTQMATSQDGTPMAAHGGKVPALVSPGEIRIHAKDVAKVAKGQKSPLSGEKIGGKPRVGGAKNSYANDTVPKTLNEGDVILPRSVTQSKNPEWEAHKFVRALMHKNGGKI